ncbi:MAG: iron chelate uptake ABC transporter family permease subunit [Candidatus Altarchaeum sp.]|nr:iron chelate uptake ABC transporter family permease subunit [Candidatus Altarchaeum sp.]
MFEIFQYEFMRNAVIAIILAGIACGIVGTYVVARKLVFISEGISHAAFGGIGIGYFLKINPVIVAIPFAILAALAIGIITKKTNVNEDTAIGMTLAFGIAIGIIFIYITPGYASDLFTYLFGSVITVSMSDIIIMIILDAIIIGIFFILRREILAISFDEEFSKIIGIPTKFLYLLTLCLIALSVVVLIRVVGIILIIALLTIPAAIAKNFTENFYKMSVLSVITGIVISIFGLLVAIIHNFPPGATIIVVLGVIFILFGFTNKIIKTKNI